MTMTMVAALSPICACACMSRCCLVVVEMVMAMMVKTMAMLHVRWWLPVHAACEVVASCACWSTARLALRRAHVYLYMQRWLYGWCAALVGESSSRIVVAAK